MSTEIPFALALKNGQVKLSEHRNPTTNAKEAPGFETGFLGKDRNGNMRPNAAVYWSVWKVEGETAHVECSNAWGAIISETRPIGSLVAYTHLIGVKVFMADGTHYTTQVNRSQTDEQIQQYFVGKMFDRGAFPEEKMVKCVKIEIDRSL